VDEQQQILKQAFPSYIGGEVDSVLSIINFDTKLKPVGSFIVSVNSEVIIIPDRIYIDEPKIIETPTLSEIQLGILSCIFTRHYNGFEREKQLKNIITTGYVWIPPFVIKLLGEYVIEILQVIGANIDKLNMDVYKQFLASNRSFYRTTKQRVISYWNCYYRRQYPERNKYVGFQIIDFLDQLI
jgi:hypothetical protein